MTHTECETRRRMRGGDRQSRNISELANTMSNKQETNEIHTKIASCLQSAGGSGSRNSDKNESLLQYVVIFFIVWFFFFCFLCAWKLWILLLCICCVCVRVCV